MILESLKCILYPLLMAVILFCLVLRFFSDFDITLH